MNSPTNIVFISYRRSDVGIARALAELLGALGHSVFIDVQSISLGKNWQAEIFRAARAAHTMIVLWSRNARSSGYMQREWQMAAPDCRIIPIRLDGSELVPELAQRQALNLNVAERLLARIAELALQGVPRKEATGRLISELRTDGIELDARQKRAVDGAFGALMGFSLGSLFWLGSRSLHALIAPAGASVVAGLGVGVFGLVHATSASNELIQCKASQACPEPLPQLNDGGDNPRPDPSVLPVFEPQRLDLGRRAVGWQETVTAALVLKNPNATPLVLNPRAGATGQPSVQLVEHDCRDLGPGASCQVKLRVGPTHQLFPATASIEGWVEAGGAKTPVVGVLAPRAPTPIIPAILRVSVQLNVLTKELGQAVGTNKLIVRNGSGGGLRVSNARIKGTSFTILRNDCKDVPPERFCSIEIEFKPRTLGQHRGELELSLNTPAQRQLVSLAGKMLCTVPDLGAEKNQSDQAFTEAAAAAGFNLKIDVEPKKKTGGKVQFVGQNPAKGTAAECHSTMVAKVERYDVIE